MEGFQCGADVERGVQFRVRNILVSRTLKFSNESIDASSEE